MDKQTGEGRDRDHAATLARAYVTARPDMFAFLATMTLEQCVAFIDLFRAQGADEQQWQVEAWILAKWDPQNIGGELEPAVSALFDSPVP